MVPKIGSLDSLSIVWALGQRLEKWALISELGVKHFLWGKKERAFFSCSLQKRCNDFHDLFFNVPIFAQGLLERY